MPRGSSPRLKRGDHMPARLWHDSLKEARLLIKQIDNTLEDLARKLREELEGIAEVAIFESEMALGSRGLVVSFVPTVKKSRRAGVVRFDGEINASVEVIVYSPQYLRLQVETEAEIKNDSKPDDSSKTFEVFWSDGFPVSLEKLDRMLEASLRQALQRIALYQLLTMTDGHEKVIRSEQIEEGAIRKLR